MHRYHGGSNRGAIEAEEKMSFPADAEEEVLSLTEAETEVFFTFRGR